MTPNPPSDHDGLRHREANQGGGGSAPGDDQPGTDLDEIRQRAATVASAGQSIIAQALSNDSTQFLESVRQKGGQ
jgi:hypothetical protein